MDVKLDEARWSAVRRPCARPVTREEFLSN